MQRVVVLGMGGTIAGVARPGMADGQYEAGVLAVDALLQGRRIPSGWAAAAEQVASIDSKDLSWAHWQALTAALARHLGSPDVGGVVLTHGTDTLEETACLLDWLHDQRLPVVLTAAMRPATAPDADGPANLDAALAAVAALAAAGLGGVWVAVHGCLWRARDLRKAHSHAIDAFDGGGAAAAARWDETAAAWVSDRAWGARLPQPPLWAWFAQQASPRVVCVFSHADADGWLVRAALAAAAQGEPLDGLVVACTGHGTVHVALEAALVEAARQGVVVWRASRAARGGVTPTADARWPATGTLTAGQARLALALQLLRAPERPDVLGYLLTRWPADPLTR